MVGEKKMASAVSIEAKPSAVGLKVTSYEHVPGPGKQPADVLCPSNGGLLNVTVLATAITFIPPNGIAISKKSDAQTVVRASFMAVLPNEPKEMVAPPRR